MTRTRAVLLAALAIVALTAAVYAPVARYPFVEFDDPYYVYLNTTLKTATGTAAVRYALTADLGGNWHPLVWASFFFDRWAWHLAPGPMHAENVALHAAAAVVLLLLLTDATGRVGRSAAVAALFAVHPMHVESVAWLSERKDVLSTLPLLLAVWAYVRYARAATAARRAGWYAAVAGGFALSLTGKSMGLTLPAVLLLLDVWPLRRPAGWPRVVLEKMPLLGLTVGIAAVTVVAQRASGATELIRVSAVDRLANAVLAYAGYVGKLFVPADLAAFYPFRDDVPVPAGFAAGALLAGVTAAAWRWRTTKPYLLVGWLWFLGTLVPTIGLVQVGGQAMADRYSYFPSIGLSLAVAWLVADLTRDRRVSAAIACGAVLACAVVAARQVTTWRDTRTLWEHAVAATGENYFAEEALGHDDYSAGRRGDAETHFRRAIGFAPDRVPAAYDGLGLCEAGRGEVGDAITAFTAAVRLRPGRADFRLHLADALAAAGESARAAAEYRAVLSLDPSSDPARAGLTRSGELPRSP